MSNGLTKLQWLWVIPVLAFVGCNGFDNDEDWEVVTQSTFFTVQDTGSGANSIWEATPAGLNPDWHIQFGISSSNPVSFSVFNDKALICDPLTDRILRIDLANEEIDETFEPELGTAHLATEGFKYICAADSVNGRLLFLKLRNAKESTLATSFSPKRLLFNGGKFYVQEGCCTVGIYHESALALITRIEFEGEIIQMAFDKNFTLKVITKGIPNNLQYGISASADLLTQGASNAPFQGIRYSDVLIRRYGKEYLEDIIQNENLLNIPEWTDSVNAFEADFREGTVYYVWNDSIHRKEIGSDSLTWKAFLGGQILETNHYRDYRNQ